MAAAIMPRGEEPGSPPGIDHRVTAVVALPPLLVNVQAPASFSPSHLGEADSCLLRAVLASGRVVAPLPSHPAADLGTAFHLLLERAVKGEIERRGTAESDAQRELQSILAETNARWAFRAGGVSLDLQRVWPPILWRRKVRLVIDQAVRYMSGQTLRPSDRRAAGSGAAIDFASLPPVGTFAEVRMRAPSLRLAGRADVIEKSVHGVTIRDLKTGRVIEDDGSIRAHVSRQLQLYGLMARAESPNVSLRLVVDDGTEREVGFTPTDAQTLHDWLRDLLAVVPAGESVEATRIASFGPACHGCGFRHACPAYHRNAPDAWRMGALHRLPLDTWGAIEGVEPEIRGTSRLRLRDAAGRLVVVSGLHTERTRDLVVGDLLYLFGMQTRDRVGGDVATRHPLNFFEESPDAPYAKAWSLAVFRQPA